MVLGFWAGIAAAFVDTPIFLIKNRMQCSNHTMKETLGNYAKIFYSTFRAEGLRGMFTGNTSNCIMMGPSYAIFYLVYDTLLPLGVSPFFCGVAAIWTCWPVFYPFDVMRTRMQTHGQFSSWARKYFTFRYFCRQLFGGPFRRWFPGLSITMLRAGPRYGITMAMTEKVKNSLKSKD